MSKVLIIIPAYNEAENIERVVSNIIENYSQYDYVVINDGSKDSTSKICKKNNYNLIDLSVNCGLAGAFQAGIKYAQRNNYDYALQYDGDGQHNPKYIGEMLKAFEENNIDIVIGSRFKTEKKPKSMRMMGNNVISLSIKLTTGQKITDPTSGMRMYDKKMIDLLASTMDLGPEPDTMAYLIRCGAKIQEIQVEMNERIAGESYLNFMKSIQYMTHVCMSILFVQWFRRKDVLQLRR